MLIIINQIHKKIKNILDTIKKYVNIEVDNINIVIDMINNLEAILKEKGLKKSWVARKLGTSGQTVTNWSKGYNYPDLSKAEKLAKLLNTTVQKIFFDEISNINIDKDNSKIKETEKAK